MPKPILPKRPFVLIIRDGWGQNPHPEMNSYNAIFLAKHPVADRLLAEYPHTLIHTSGEDVGLPAGVMGNSEVGHQNIGAGRIVDQETMRITRTIRDGSFFTNKTLKEAFAHAKKFGSKVHIMGLCSDGQVHSDQTHAYALLEMAKREGVAAERVLVHAILDGRDTPPESGLGYIQQLEAKCREIGVGRIATVCGRFYMMDRDNQWDRVQRGYDLLTLNQGEKFATAAGAIQSYYDKPTNASQKGDEFVTPAVIGPGGKVEENDTFLFFNYRGDRPREITKAFVYSDEQFGKEKNGGFKRAAHPANVYFATMSAYEAGLPVHVSFDKPARMKNLFGEYLADLGLTEFRSAETQKYAHVTFFFNDYREAPFPGEDRKLVDSPRVATFDKKPEMAAPEVAEVVVREIAKGLHDVYVINFANCDMVGHTGDLPAAIQAVETVDACVGRVIEATLKQGGDAIITADHGNCEQMWDPIHNCPHTAHTTYEVPLIVVDDRYKGAKLKEGGRLADIVPTALKLLGLPQPQEMTGESLVEEARS